MQDLTISSGYRLASKIEFVNGALEYFKRKTIQARDQDYTFAYTPTWESETAALQ